MVGDSIVMPYCFERFEVLTKGPLRFEVCLRQSPRVVCGDTIRESRLITLDKGSNFNKMTVWYEGITKPVSLCSGVVIQREDTSSVVLGRNYVAYTDPTDQPNVHHAPLFVAALFPDGQVITQKVMLWESSLTIMANNTLITSDQPGRNMMSGRKKSGRQESLGFFVQSRLHSL